MDRGCSRWRAIAERWRALAESARGWNENESPGIGPIGFSRSLRSPLILKAALQTSKNTQTGQAGAIGQASGTRIDRVSLVEQATASSPNYPISNLQCLFLSPIRREFQLPANRAFIG